MAAWSALAVFAAAVTVMSWASARLATALERIGARLRLPEGLLGLSALVAGRVSIGRQGLWFKGGSSLIVSAVVTALVLQWISVQTSLVLLAVVLLPHFVLTHASAANRPARATHRKQALSRGRHRPCAPRRPQARNHPACFAQGPGLPLQWRWWSLRAWRR